MRIKIVSAIVIVMMLITAAPVSAGIRQADLSICRSSDGAAFNLTRAAGQKLYRYDTLQGACANDGYGYFTQYNRKNDKTKIVKVRLADMRVVKVSKPLNIKHANGITYNTRKDIIVVANSTPRPKRLSVIDPRTLKLKYHKTIKTKWRNFRGVGAIAYNEKHNCYICYTRKYHDLVLLNEKLKPYKRIRKNAGKNMIYQGLDSLGDRIYLCQSFKGRRNYNLITVYNMKGRVVSKVKLRTGKPKKELETIFHDGTRFYAGFYSFYGAKADEQSRHVKRKNYVFRFR